MNIVASEIAIGLPGNKNFLPYYTNTPWAENDEYFVFFSSCPGRGGLALYAFFPNGGMTRKLVDLTRWHGVPENIQEEEMLHGVFLPGTHAMLLPRGHEVFRVTLSDGLEQIVFTAPESTVIAGPMCLSADERHLCFGIYPPGADWQDPATTMETVVLDTVTGQTVYSGKINFQANHFQFFPDGESILFAHEGKTETIPDRLNVLHWPTGKHRCVHAQQHDVSGKLVEYVGHERVAGNKIVAVRYPVSLIDFGIILVDPADGSCELVDADDYWHASANTDGTRFVMDTMWWGRASRTQPYETDIIMYDYPSRKKYRLKTLHTDNRRQIFHPHPQFSRTGDKVLFIAKDEPESPCGKIIMQQLASRQDS